MNNVVNIAEHQQAQAPLMSSTDLSEAVRSTAMLADVTIRMWSGSMTDQSIMEEAKARAGATGNVGRAVKNLLAGADTHLKECKSAYTNVRTVHYSLTLPWVSDPHAMRATGARLLTTMLFDRYLEEMGKAKRAATAALDAFISVYPNCVATAQQNLGALVKPEEYPTADEVRKLFHVSSDFQPIPSGQHFRGLPDQTMDRLAKHLEKRQQRMVAAAQQSMWEQARDRVAHAVERLADPETVFRDTTIENVRELLELMPGWNVTGDERVAEITADISRMIQGVTAKTLRKDANARLEATNQGRAVIEKLRSWGL